MSRVVFAAKLLNDIAHEHTNICRQLFAGHVVGSRPMKRKKHLHRMIIIFAWHLAQCCPYYRGVRYSGVSARQELTVIVACTYVKSIPKQHGHAYKFTVEQPPAPWEVISFVAALVSSQNTPSRPLVGWWGAALCDNTKDGREGEFLGSCIPLFPVVSPLLNLASKL